MILGPNRRTTKRTALEVLQDNQREFKDLFDRAKAFLDSLDDAQKKEVPSIANAYRNTLKPNNSQSKRVKSEVPANPSKLYCYESLDDSVPVEICSPYSEAKNYASKLGVTLPSNYREVYSPNTIKKRTDFLAKAELQPLRANSAVNKFKP